MFNPDLDARIDDDHRIPADRRARQVAGTWMDTESFERRLEIPEFTEVVVEMRRRSGATTPAVDVRTVRVPSVSKVGEPLARIEAKANGTFAAPPPPFYTRPPRGPARWDELDRALEALERTRGDS